MNDSPYGLTASVWTDAGRAESVRVFEEVFAEGIEAGTVFLNRCVLVPSARRRPGLTGGAQVRLPRPCARVDWRQEQRARSQPKQVRYVPVSLLSVACVADSVPAWQATTSSRGRRACT